MSQVTADKAAQASSQSFLTALITNTALLIVEVSAFAILQQHFKRVYSPRTFLPPPECVNPLLCCFSTLIRLPENALIPYHLVLGDGFSLS